MQTAQRRQDILDILHQSAQTVSAGALAARFSVSRQVIVGDMLCCVRVVLRFLPLPEAM